jgi:hypothetical protein
MRPPRTNEREKTYGEHLKELDYDVVNSSKQGVIVSQVYRYLEDEVIRDFPDFVVIHFGIIECAIRTRPQWLQRFFSENNWNNNIVNNSFDKQYTRYIKIVLRKFYYSFIERPLYRLGVSYRWMRPKTFEFILIDIINKLFRDTPVKKIIIVGINPISKSLEKRLPKTSKSAKDFNNIMEDLSHYKNISFIDTSKMAQNCYSPDSIHFSAEGHRHLALLIKDELNGERVDYLVWKEIEQKTRLNRWKKLF